MKNIHVLPTDKEPVKGDLLLRHIWKDTSNECISWWRYKYTIVIDDVLQYTTLNGSFRDITSSFKVQNIYITSDEEIKEGDSVVLFDESGIAKVLEFKKGYVKAECFRNKVELAVGYHQLNEWKKIILTTDQDLIKNGVQAIDDEFLEWFVKNPSCEEVVFSTYHVKGDISGKLHYQIIIPKEDGIDFMANELVIEKERMYSEEDMVKSFIAGVDCNSSGGKNFEQFIEQLKKITPIARISATNIMENANINEKQFQNPLSEPLNHSLEVLLNEIKRGRPAETQKLIQSWIEQLNK